jgi:crotonobetainyl-CoA:carnitine CoA-transferase CaiB-like acyl-CoA transferase
MLGATVVRVEPPGGDVGRMVPPSCGDVGSFFRCYNRGKETVELDLATAAGRDDLRAVLAESDAFLHNWRPGRAERWGLDAPGLAKTNRRLVYAAASGWGDGPANSEIIGTDFLVQAYAGFGEGLHPLGEPPRTSRALLTDCMGALVTCEALLAALLHRARTGHGVAVGPSLLEGAMAAQAHVLDALGGGTALGDRRSPEGRPIWGPLDRPIATDDGYLAVGADEPADHRRLRQACQVAGEHRSAAADDAIAARLAEGTAEQWDKLLTEAGVPAAAVMTDLAALAVDDRFSSVVEPLSDTCRAPANPWTLTS